MIEIDIKKRLHGAVGEMDLNVNLRIEEGEFIALSGESGSGKTTLLRVLSGLESAEGRISVGSEIWQNGKHVLKSQKRGIGFVFQDYALFSTMSVEENLLYIQKDKALAAHLLEITGLSALKKRMPNSLSGGQKQRVSLCRALMNRPKLLLMDEPLSALDPEMRTKLQHEIIALHKEFRTTTIMVSHDPSEIYRLANRVIVLDHGTVTREGSPKEVFLHTQGSQKFSFEGELLDIRQVDVIYIAVIAIGQQLVEAVITKAESDALRIGQRVTIGTKAFSPIISYKP